MIIKFMFLLLWKLLSVFVIFIFFGVGCKGCEYWGVYVILKFVVEGMM